MQPCQCQTTGFWCVEVAVQSEPCRMCTSSTWVLFCLYLYKCNVIMTHHCFEVLVPFLTITFIVIFHLILETSMWSSLTSSLLCSKPRAGHCMINLSCSVTTDRVSHEKDKSVHCTLLVFGGSDCCGNFYNDTIKCAVEIPVK